jgi:hypothetical protein
MDEERKQKLIFRGGSGYKELRLELLRQLANSEGDVQLAAERVRSWI